MNKQSLDERIEKMLNRFYEIHFSQGDEDDWKPCTKAEAEAAIRQLLKDVITEVTPERTPLSHAGNSAQTNYIIGKNTTIKEVHSNAKEMGL